METLKTEKVQVGTKLIERWTQLQCTVKHVASDHILVKFESGMHSMIRQENYNKFRRL